MNIYVRLITDSESPCIKNYRPTRLYIKEHSVTKLKYFGKTFVANYENYLGSGKRWSSHINFHGPEHVRTVWISEPFLDPFELQEFALAFSELHDIVDSDEWANQQPENGLSGGYFGGWDHIGQEHYDKASATKQSQEWKDTTGKEQKRKELETKSDPEWIKNVWEPSLEVANIKRLKTINDPEWKATVWADGKRKEMATKSDPEWLDTKGKEWCRKLSEIRNDPEWKATTGKVAAARISSSVAKTLNDPVWKATKGVEAAKNKSKMATGRRRTTVNGKLTWEYPDGNGGYVPFSEFKKLRAKSG